MTYGTPLTWAYTIDGEFGAPGVALAVRPCRGLRSPGTQERRLVCHHRRRPLPLARPGGTPKPLSRSRLADRTETARVTIGGSSMSVPADASILTLPLPASPAGVRDNPSIAAHLDAALGAEISEKALWLFVVLLRRVERSSYFTVEAVAELANVPGGTAGRLVGTLVNAGLLERRRADRYEDGVRKQPRLYRIAPLHTAGGDR